MSTFLVKMSVLFPQRARTGDIIVNRVGADYRRQRRIAVREVARAEWDARCRRGA
jgi:hypothetical protein